MTVWNGLHRQRLLPCTRPDPSARAPSPTAPAAPGPTAPQARSHPAPEASARLPQYSASNATRTSHPTPTTSLRRAATSVGIWLSIPAHRTALMSPGRHRGPADLLDRLAGGLAGQRAADRRAGSPRRLPQQPPLLDDRPAPLACLTYLPRVSHVRPPCRTLAGVVFWGTGLVGGWGCVGFGG